MPQLDMSMFQCNWYEPKTNGDVAYYLLEIRNDMPGTHRTIKAKPSQLQSYRHMKALMIDQGITQPMSRIEHEQFLQTIFAVRPAPLANHQP